MGSRFTSEPPKPKSFGSAYWVGGITVPAASSGGVVGSTTSALVGSAASAWVGSATSAWVGSTAPASSVAVGFVPHPVNSIPKMVTKVKKIKNILRTFIFLSSILKNLVNWMFGFVMK
jgi:hypothetical protein